MWVTTYFHNSRIDSTTTLPSSLSIRIRLISRVSRFCRTLNRMQAAIISDGTRSVPRNRALNRLATWVKASWPNSSLRRQQNIQRKRRSHRFETFEKCFFYLFCFKRKNYCFALPCDALRILSVHCYRYCHDFFCIWLTQVDQTQLLNRILSKRILPNWKPRQLQRINLETKELKINISYGN